MQLRDYQTYYDNKKIISLANGRASSARILAKSDCVGFSVSVVKLEAGLVFDIWYKNHWETNYVISGIGRLFDLKQKISWDLEENDVYCVGPEDQHQLKAETDLLIISIFCPAVNGDETHDKDGSYPPTGPVPSRTGKMFIVTAHEQQAEPNKNIKNTEIINKSSGVGIILSKLEILNNQQHVLNNRQKNNANYILKGEGILTDLSKKIEYAVKPNTLFFNTQIENMAIIAKSDLTILNVLGLTNKV